MKNTIIMVVYIITFFAMYFVISMFGIALGFNYKSVIEDEAWFIVYSIFLGWWIAFLTAQDVYELIEKKSNNYL
jgi:hypothetical protein